jgi:hypothetical protein
LLLLVLHHHAPLPTQNARYYARFPDDVAAVALIVLHLANHLEGGVRLPSGDLLTPRMLQALGLSGLGSGGAREWGCSLGERPEWVSE